MITSRVDPAPLLVPRTFAARLLDFYTYRDPRRPGRRIRGYDRAHALRTARMCAAVALRLGYDRNRVRQYQIACLLHDLGRAGLDSRLFGTIWSWAHRHGIPTRPAEWRAAHPKTRYGKETEAFLRRYGRALEASGVVMDAWAREQVEMRLGYARRLARQMRVVRPRLKRLRVTWAPWMERIMLYYYYPEQLHTAPGWVRQLAEILVACEQFEAYSNQQRGRDYYVRTRESLREAFAYLGNLRKCGVLSASVVTAVQELVGAGAFDEIVRGARGRPVTARERAFARRSAAGEA